MGVTGRRGRRSKYLLDDVKEMGEYWKLKEEALDRTVWRTGFGECYESDVRQKTELIDKLKLNDVRIFLAIFESISVL